MESYIAPPIDRNGKNVKVTQKFNFQNFPRNQQNSTSLNHSLVDLVITAAHILSPRLAWY